MATNLFMEGYGNEKDIIIHNVKTGDTEFSRKSCQLQSRRFVIRNVFLFMMESLILLTWRELQFSYLERIVNKIFPSHKQVGNIILPIVSTTTLGLSYSFQEARDSSVTHNEVWKFGESIWIFQYPKPPIILSIFRKQNHSNSWNYWNQTQIRAVGFDSILPITFF